MSNTKPIVQSIVTVIVYLILISYLWYGCQSVAEWEYKCKFHGGTVVLYKCFKGIEQMEIK